jgi:hypothetical protein
MRERRRPIHRLVIAVAAKAAEFHVGPAAGKPVARRRPDRPFAPAAANSRRTGKQPGIFAFQISLGAKISRYINWLIHNVTRQKPGINSSIIGK